MLCVVRCLLLGVECFVLGVVLVFDVCCVVVCLLFGVVFLWVFGVSCLVLVLCCSCCCIV